MSTPERNSDEELMEMVKQGKLEAMEELVRRYERPLFGYACRVTGNRSESQDIFQETFLRVYQKRSSYRTGARFRPWVYQICLNLCRDGLRRRQRRPEEELPETPLVDPEAGPAEQAERKALAARVRQAVESLPIKQQEVFLLAHYEQLSYPEVASVLGLPVGTVKSRMFHAMGRLTELLSEVKP